MFFFATEGIKKMIHKVEMSKGFDVDAIEGKISVKPSYDIKSNSGDVAIKLTTDKSFVEVKGSKSEQKLTVSRKVTENQRIAPSLTSDGKVALEWEASLSGKNSLLTKLEPKEKINIKWTDGPWIADVNAPLNDGFKLENVDVSLKRKVEFF